MTKMDKEYIEKEYEQAIKEYNAALTEDDLDTARRTMKRLEAIAMQDYGFDYADELAMKKEVSLYKRTLYSQTKFHNVKDCYTKLEGMGYSQTSSICRLSDK